MKLKAFTIAELIVVLIISGIVIGLSFWGINVLVGYFNKSSQSYSNAQEVLSLEKDIREHKTLAINYKIQPNGIILIDSNKDSTNYITVNDTIYRYTSFNKKPMKVTNSVGNIILSGDSIILKIDNDILGYRFKLPISTEINTILQ